MVHVFGNDLFRCFAGSFLCCSGKTVVFGYQYPYKEHDAYDDVRSPENEQLIGIRCILDLAERVRDHVEFQVEGESYKMACRKHEAHLESCP